VPANTFELTAWERLVVEEFVAALRDVIEDECPRLVVSTIDLEIRANTPGTLSAA
jgi:hypothetical protein